MGLGGSRLFRLKVRCEEQAQPSLSEVSDRASELAGKAQEQLQSVGASLWQWGA